MDIIIILIMFIISDLPANFVRSLCYEEADVALLNDEVLAWVDSKLAALALWTAHCYQQNPELRQTQAIS